MGCWQVTLLPGNKKVFLLDKPCLIALQSHTYRNDCEEDQYGFGSIQRRNVTGSPDGKGTISVAVRFRCGRFRTSLGVSCEILPVWTARRVRVKAWRRPALTV